MDIKKTLMCSLVMCLYISVAEGQAKVKGTYAKVFRPAMNYDVDGSQDSIVRDVIRPREFTDLIELKSAHKSVFSSEQSGLKEIKGTWALEGDTLIITQINPISNAEWVLRFILTSDSLVELNRPAEVYYKRKRRFKRVG